MESRKSKVMNMRKKTRKWTVILMCGLMTAGVGAGQVIPAIAKSECTCEITVHGSNCPLWECTCEGLTTGEHTEGCALYGLAEDLTECVCEPSAHAEGCPRYREEDTVSLENVGAEGQAEPSSEPQEPVKEETEEQMPQEPAGEEPEIPDQTPQEPAEEELPETSGGSATEGSSGSEETAQPEETAEPSGTPVPEDPEEEPLDMPAPDEVPEGDWEYPSGWEGYGDGRMEGNLLAAAEAFILDRALEEHIGEVQGALDHGTDALLAEDEDNFGDILAVYAVLSGQTEDYPYGVALDTEEKVETLRSVYWSMTQVTGVSNRNGAAISVRRLSAQEGAELYEFSEEQKALLSNLAEQKGTVEEIVGESIFASLTEEEFAAVCEQIPEEISADRRAVLMAALSLEEKVDYFWGGKSLAYGWDERWGQMRTVTCEGSDTTGTARPMGLDCSGFVSWAFLNAYGQNEAVGEGTDGQGYSSRQAAWTEAQPGDLVFYHSPDSATNHVGIVVTADESGPKTVVHCGTGGVKVTGPSGFTLVYRPAVYS